MTARQGSRSRTSRGRGPDSIVKNIASTFTAQMMTASLTAVLTLFLVRALGPKQYGLFAVTIGISSIAIAFVDLGISSSTVRFVAEHRGRDAKVRELITDALKLKVVLTGLGCALLAALASVIAGAYGNPELVWPLRAIALATFGQSTYLMLLGISAALGRAVVNVRLVAAESLLEVSASVALVLAGGGAAGAAFGRAIGYVLGAVIAACVVLRLSEHGTVRFWSLPGRETVRLVGGYARPVFAIDVSYTLSGSFSVLFLGAYLGSAASGIFSAPAKLITLIGYVGLSTAYGVAPRLTRGPGQEPNVRALNGALRALIGFQCLMLAPAVVWAVPITHVLLGPGYSRSAVVLAALAPYIFFSGLAPLVTASVSYVGEAGRRVPIALATLALVAAGGVILIPRYGVVGAAIATDIAFGFYTLAHIWLCRRLLQLRIGMLVWSLACGLTAAAAMGIVLASVGTQHLTIFDWLKGGAGGFAAYVAMLLFTREIRGAHIARATATIGTLLARVHPAPGPRRSPGPEVLPHREAAATTGVADSVRDDPTPTDRTFSSTAVAESPDLTPAGASASIEHVDPPMEDSIAGRDEPRVRDRLGAGADTARGALAGVLGRRRRRPAVARPAAPSRPGFVATLPSRGDRSPAARPPEWVEGLVEGLVPTELVKTSAPQRSPAAHPPRWLDDAFRGETVPASARAAADADNGERRLPPADQPRHRSTGPARLPHGIAGSVSDDAPSTDRTFSSTAAAESPDVSPAGASASIDRVESPIEVSIAGRDEPRGRDRLVAGGDMTRSALGGVLGRRRRRPAVARPAAPSRPGFVATPPSRGDRSPAATPPERVEGLVPEPAEPAELVEASAPQRSAAHPPRWLNDAFGRQPVPPPGLGDPAPTDGTDAALPDPRHHDPSRAAPLANAGERKARAAADAGNGERRLSPAAQPPDWLSVRRSSGQAGEGPSAVVEDPRRQTKAPGASPDTGDTSASRTDIVYQIAWRLEEGEGEGVFELRPVEPSDTRGAPAVEQSPPVPWGWRMAPAPIPGARRAHEALVDRLLAAGWRRAGSGDTWFAHCFRSPDCPHPDQARHWET
jgi:O-antigen/teichoic acid export membrane protein